MAAQPQIRDRGVRGGGRTADHLRTHRTGRGCRPGLDLAAEGRCGSVRGRHGPAQAGRAVNQGEWRNRRRKAGRRSIRTNLDAAIDTHAAVTSRVAMPATWGTTLRQGECSGVELDPWCVAKGRRDPSGAARCRGRVGHAPRTWALRFTGPRQLLGAGQVDVNKPTLFTTKYAYFAREVPFRV